jgi:hypothetical protein
VFPQLQQKRLTAELGRPAVDAEPSNVGVERLRLFHVADVSSMRDDGKLGGRNGTVQLFRDVHRTAPIVLPPQQQRRNVNRGQEISRVYLRR